MPTPARRRSDRPAQKRLLDAPRMSDHAYTVAQMRHLLERMRRLEAIADAGRAVVRDGGSSEARVRLAAALAALDLGGMRV